MLDYPIPFNVLFNVLSCIIYLLNRYQIIMLSAYIALDKLFLGFGSDSSNDISVVNILHTLRRPMNNQVCVLRILSM